MDPSSETNNTSWSPSQLRNHEYLTLATDVALLKCIQNLSTHIANRSKSLVAEIHTLERDAIVTAIQMENCIQNLNLISTKQFIEKRVYDEEEEMKMDKAQQAQATFSSSIDILPKIKQGIFTGLPAIQSHFSTSQGRFGDSNTLSTSENSLYTSRPLPFILGSSEFINSSNIGIVNINPEIVVNSNGVYKQEPALELTVPSLPLTSEVAQSDEAPFNLESLSSDKKIDALKKLVVNETDSKREEENLETYSSIRDELSARLKSSTKHEDIVSSSETKAEDGSSIKSLQTNCGVIPQLYPHMPLLLDRRTTTKKGLFDDSTTDSDEENPLIGNRNDISDFDHNITSTSSGNQSGDKSQKTLLPGRNQIDPPKPACEKKVGKSNLSISKGSAVKVKEHTNLFFSSDSEDELFDTPVKSHEKAENTEVSSIERLLPVKPHSISEKNINIANSKAAISDVNSSHDRPDFLSTSHKNTTSNIFPGDKSLPNKLPNPKKETSLFSDSESDDDLFGTIQIKSSSHIKSIEDNTFHIDNVTQDQRLKEKKNKPLIIPDPQILTTSVLQATSSKTDSLFSDDEDDLFGNVRIPNSESVIIGPSVSNSTIGTKNIVSQNNFTESILPPINRAQEDSKTYSNEKNHTDRSFLEQGERFPSSEIVPTPDKMYLYSYDSSDEDLFMPSNLMNRTRKIDINHVKEVTISDQSEKMTRKMDEEEPTAFPVSLKKPDNFSKPKLSNDSKPAERERSPQKSSAWLFDDSDDEDDLFGMHHDKKTNFAPELVTTPYLEGKSDTVTIKIDAQILDDSCEEIMGENKLNSLQSATTELLQQPCTPTSSTSSEPIFSIPRTDKINFTASGTVGSSDVHILSHTENNSCSTADHVLSGSQTVKKETGEEPDEVGDLRIIGEKICKNGQQSFNLESSDEEDLFNPTKLSLLSSRSVVSEVERESYDAHIVQKSINRTLDSPLIDQALKKEENTVPNVIRTNEGLISIPTTSPSSMARRQKPFSQGSIVEENVASGLLTKPYEFSSEHEIIKSVRTIQPSVIPSIDSVRDLRSSVDDNKLLSTVVQLVPEIAVSEKTDCSFVSDAPKKNPVLQPSCNDSLSTSQESSIPENLPIQSTFSENTTEIGGNQAEETKTNRIASLKLSLSKQPGSLIFRTPSSSDGDTPTSTPRKPIGGVLMIGASLQPPTKKTYPSSVESSTSSPLNSEFPSQTAVESTIPTMDSFRITLDQSLENFNSAASAINKNSLDCVAKLRPRLPSSRRQPSRAFRRSCITESDSSRFEGHTSEVLSDHNKMPELLEKSANPNKSLTDATSSRKLWEPTEEKLSENKKKTLFFDSESSDDELFNPAKSTKQPQQKQSLINRSAKLHDELYDANETVSNQSLKPPLRKNMLLNFLDDGSDDDELFSGNTKVLHEANKKAEFQPQNPPTIEDPLSRESY